MRLCDYGCEQEATYKFGSGKWCCSEVYQKCPANRKKYGSPGSKNPMKREEVRKKFRGENNPSKRESVKRKRRETFLERYGINLNCPGKVGASKQKETVLEKYKVSNISQVEEFKKKKKETWLRKYGVDNPGKTDFSREASRNHMKNGGSVYANSCPVKGYRNNKEWMRNGGAAYIHKFIKNPSKPELRLRAMVKELYFTSEDTYKILNYDVDVALPEYKIAIEFDGRYHFDTEEHKDYHNKRQQEIEQEGWKFVRYTMFDEFPTTEQVKEDIEEILKRKV